MILLETNNRVVEESISVRIKNALAGYVTLLNYMLHQLLIFNLLHLHCRNKPENTNIFISDYAGVLFHISNLEGQKNQLRVSVIFSLAIGNWFLNKDVLCGR